MTASSISSFNTYQPDVLFVGGGPIGLWTAIQTKILTKKEVLVLEKYKEYKRADIRLNIAASSLKGIPKHQPLENLVKQWGNRAVPIKDMEDGLSKCAHELGIKILKGVEADPKEIYKQFPSAKVVIGADGAKSKVRSEIFGNRYKFNTPMQYIAQVRYMIKTPMVPIGSSKVQKWREAAESYSKQKFAGHLITQHIVPQDNGQSQVTLRIFINEKTYREMSDATFSNPYYFEKDLDKVPSILRDTLIKWWGSQTNHAILSDIQKTNKMTVIPLASYAAKDVVRVDENDNHDQVVTAIAGDASQAFPFFRAINNGFLLATRLAKCIGRAFDELQKAEDKKIPLNAKEKMRRNKLFASSFNPYSRYSTFRAYIERIKAFVKNLFIVLSSFWIRVSSIVPWQTVKLNERKQREFYQRGANIWEKLSGVKPPPMPVSRKILNLKSFRKAQA